MHLCKKSSRFEGVLDTVSSTPSTQRIECQKGAEHTEHSTSFEIKSALGLNFWIFKILMNMAYINAKASHKTVWFAAR
jgi:hypothetical protein